MKKLSKKHRLYFQLCLGAALVVLIPLLITTFQQTKSAQAAWFDDNWAYRKAVNIATHNASENNVYINLTGANDIDTSDTARYQTDCGDLRFTDAGGKLLQYYIVSGCSSADTVVHVFFSTMPAGAQTVYYYYGNPTVQNGGNAADFATQASSYTFTTIGSEEKTPGPIAYWKFDDGTGTNTQDSTTNNNDGTISGATWQIEDQCIAGKCLNFNGTSDYIDTNSSDLRLSTTDTITVSAWVYPRGQTSDNGHIVSDYNRTQPKGWSVIVNTDNTVSASNFESGGNQRQRYSSALTLNRWYFVTAIIYPDNTLPDIYINGALDNGNNLTQGSVTQLNMGSTNVTIGRQANYTSNERYFNGKIDDLKVYKFARSAAQIKTDYNSRGSVKGASSNASTSSANNPAALNNGLVGYWKLDESSTGAGAVSRSDSSGNGNALTDTATVTSNPGKFGNAGQFTRINSEYLSKTSNTSLQTGDIDFTVSAWVYLDSQPTANAYMGIMDKYLNAGQREWILAWRNDATKTKQFYFNVSPDGTNTVNVAANTFGETSTGAWYFVVAWHDSVNDTINIQVNNGGVDSTAHSGGVFVGTDPVEIGRAVIHHWDGRIDEARFYKRVLSPVERTALYNFAPGPVGYWNMDENSGTSANDMSGNGDTGTLTLGPTWKQGKYGSAVNFDGSDDYINITGNAALRPSILTLSAWIKPSASISSGASEKVLIRYVGSSGLDRYGYQLSLSSNAGGNLGKLDFLVGKGTGGSGWNTYSSTKNSWNANQWYYVSVTTDGTNYRFYIDGIAENSGSVSTLYYDSIDSTAQVGGISTSGFTFSGPIDEVKIYSYARTSKQIVEDMNAGHPAVGSPVGSAVGHWKFDEGVNNTCSGGTNDACNSGSGGSTLDGAGSGFASPATSTSGWTNNGKFGKALIFDGTDDDVNVGDPSNGAFDFGLSDSFTLTAWIKTSGATGPSDAQCIICKDVGSLQKSWWFRTSNTNVLQFLLSDGTNEIPVNGATTVTTGQWIHVAAVRDVVSDTLKVYVNGRQDGSVTDTTTSGTENANPVKIGEFNSGSTRQFNGTIDEPKIYRYALTSDELKIDMNRGSSQVLGSISDKTGAGYEGGKQAANQEYCVPGDTSTSCAAPIAKWDFEENTGTTTFDKSRNAYNGTLTSTSSPLPSWILGKKGAALSFDGSTNYVTTSTLGSFGSGLGGGATLEFWINTTTTATTKQIGVLNTVNTAYVVDFNRDKALAAAVGKTDFFIRDNDSKIVNAEISTNIYDGKWHHIAWSITNPSSNSFSVYVDGVAQTLSYGTQTAPTTFSNFQFPFMIGAVNNRGTPASFINAKFDQVKIFNYGRSAAQVAWDYNRGAPVGHWKFDECQGTSTNDSSGNSNTGTITVGGLGTQTAVGTCTGSANTMWKDGASGKYNSSLDFDGTDDYVNVTSSTTLTISNDFTYSTWVKSTTTTPDYQNLFEYNNGSSIGVHAYLTGANNATANRGPLKVFVNFLDTSGNNHQYVTTNSNVWTSNQWYHITVLRNGSTIQIYIDGRLQDVSLDTTVGNTAISSSTVLQTTYDLQFGLRKSNSTLPLSGQIDDTKIYNYALTPVQVKGLYNGGATRFGPVTGSP